jgi:hypothetical protein
MTAPVNLRQTENRRIAGPAQKAKLEPVQKNLLTSLFTRITLQIERVQK